MLKPDSTPPDHPSVDASDIQWTSVDDLTPRRERLPARLVELLDRDQLRLLVEDLQDDVSALRVTLHEALQSVAKLTGDRNRLRRALRGRSR
jgi:hypothetical protein